MPYASVEGAKGAGFPTTAEGISMTLSQINKLASIYDAVKAAGTAKEPFSVAWVTWKKLYNKVGDKWIKTEKKTYELETVDIDDVQIFDIEDDPNGHKYTEKDLEIMVQGFYETLGQLKPFLKLGHDEEQKLAQNSGMPALGWLGGVRKFGKKLMGNLKKVPKKLAELIKVGAYRRISPEVFWNITVNGKKYPRLLKAASLLGADTPACMNMDDIMALYGIENKEVIQSAYAIQTYGGYEYELLDVPKEVDEIIEEVDEMELKEKVEKLEQENADLKKSAEEEKQKADDAVKEAKEEKDKADKAEADKKKMEDDAAAKKEEDTKDGAKDTVEKLIKDKHLLPADSEGLSTLLFDLESVPEVRKYKIGKDEKTPREIIVDILSKQVVDMNTEEGSEVGVPATDEEGEATHQKAKKYAKEHDVSYKVALVKISPRETK